MGALITMGLLWMDEPADRGIVDLDGSRVTRMIEKPAPDQVFDDYLVNGGIYAVQPAVVDRIPSGYCDFSCDIFPRMLTSGEALYGHRLQGQLLSTDTPGRYQDTCSQVAAGHFDLP